MKTYVLGVMLLLLAGCQSAPAVKSKSELARFYLESGEEPTALLTLPQSGLQISVKPKPVFTEYDIVNVEIAQAELGQCLAIQLTPEATLDLYRLTLDKQGSRLVLVLGGVPFGARRMSEPLDQGTIFVFLEVPDASLPALVATLKETCVALHPLAAL